MGTGIKGLDAALESSNHYRRKLGRLGEICQRWRRNASAIPRSLYKCDPLRITLFEYIVEHLQDARKILPRVVCGRIQNFRSGRERGAYNIGEVIVNQGEITIDKGT